MEVNNRVMQLSAVISIVFTAPKFSREINAWICEMEQFWGDGEAAALNICIMLLSIMIYGSPPAVGIDARIL